MDLRNTALFVLIFLLGALSASVVYEVSFVKQAINAQPNIPEVPAQSVVQTVSDLTTGKALDRISPGDHVKESQIKVYNDKIELEIPNAIWSRFTNTHSMDPFLDDGSNGIEIVPQSENDIKVGDIISYQATWTDGVIIHRVISIGKDDNGTYFIIKGDNNPVQDPEKVRFNQIKGILVGIIY